MIQSRPSLPLAPLAPLPSYQRVGRVTQSHSHLARHSNRPDHLYFVPINPFVHIPPLFTKIISSQSSLRPFKHLQLSTQPTNQLYRNGSQVRSSFQGQSAPATSLPCLDRTCRLTSDPFYFVGPCLFRYRLQGPCRFQGSR